MSETAGRQWSVGRFNALNNGLIYVKDIDENNQGLFVKLKISGTVVEREIDTSPVE